MISPIDIIGSLVYRTREALNKNTDFLVKIKNYRYYDLISDNGQFQLWHYPGTAEEISQRYMQMQDLESSFLKYPAVFNYQNILQQSGITQGCEDVFFNLAFVAPTCNDWGTETRKDKVFKLVLYDIYEEFFKQIKRCKHILSTMGDIVRKKYDVYTTGQSVSKILEFQYCDYMDAIQIINLRLSIKNICDRDIELIEEESNKVFGTIKI